MAMSMGSGGGMKSDINITPLVDVVLVLLIIFMVVTPLTQMGYGVQVPPKVESATPPPSQDQLIVRMDAQQRMFINKEQIPEAEFSRRLEQALVNRSAKVVFFAADGDLLYERVAAFMDVVRDAGAQNLGMVFDDMRPGAGLGSTLGQPAQ